MWISFNATAILPYKHTNKLRALSQSEQFPRIWFCNYHVFRFSSTPPHNFLYVCECVCGKLVAFSIYSAILFMWECVCVCVCGVCEQTQFRPTSKYKIYYTHWLYFKTDELLYIFYYNNIIHVNCRWFSIPYKRFHFIDVLFGLQRRFNSIFIWIVARWESFNRFDPKRT